MEKEFNLFEEIMFDRMSDEDKESYQELQEMNETLWQDDNDRWISLDDDCSIPTFDCIALLKDYEEENFLLIKYVFEPYVPIGGCYDDVDDGGYDYRGISLETGKVYGSTEIYNKYSHIKVIKRLM